MECLFRFLYYLAKSRNAANERTFLGYLRTGQAFAMLGVIVSHPPPAIQYLRQDKTILMEPSLIRANSLFVLTCLN